MKSNFHINQMKYKVNSGYSKYIPHIGEYDMWRFTDLVIDDNGITGKYEIRDLRSEHLKQMIAEGRVHIGIYRRKASCDGNKRIPWYIYPDEYWTINLNGGEFTMSKPPIFHKNVHTAEYLDVQPFMDIQLVVFFTDGSQPLFRFYIIPNSLTRLYY